MIYFIENIVSTRDALFLLTQSVSVTGAWKTLAFIFGILHLVDESEVKYYVIL